MTSWLEGIFVNMNKGGLRCLCNQWHLWSVGSSIRKGEKDVEGERLDVTGSRWTFVERGRWDGHGQDSCGSRTHDPPSRRLWCYRAPWSDPDPRSLSTLSVEEDPETITVVRVPVEINTGVKVCRKVPLYKRSKTGSGKIDITEFESGSLKYEFVDVILTTLIFCWPVKYPR